MKKGNRRLIIFVAALVILFILAKTNILNSLFYLRTDSIEWKKHGEERALKYVSDKYGQDAKVISTKLLAESKKWHLFGVCYGDVAVKMEMNGKKFTVLISGNEDREYETSYLNAGNVVDSYGVRYGADNYQEEEIREAFIRALDEKGITDLDDFDLEYGYIDYKNGSFNYMSSVFFDGTNFEETARSIEIYYDWYSFKGYTHESDLSKINVNDLTNEFGAHTFRISNYKNDSWVNRFRDGYKNIQIVDHTDELIDSLICENGYANYFDFTQHEYDGLIYYALGGTYCNVTKLSKSEYPEKFVKHNIVSDLYGFDTDAYIVCLVQGN